MSRPVAYLCDFDGTIAPSDVGARVARRFATDDGAVFRALEPRWRSGELGHRELTEAECAVLKVSEGDAAAFVRTTAAPGAFYIAGSMYAVGRVGKNRKLASLGLHATEALIAGEVVAVALKGVVGRQRPYVQPRDARNYQLFRGLRGGDAYRSFPSGHTVAAFAAAAAFTAETSRNAPNTTWFVAPVMYGGAALAGASRMYDNRHWASDVIIGAAIGTFAGLKVVRYHDSRPNNGIDRLLLTGSLVRNEAGGHTLRWSVLPGVLLGPR